MEALPNHIQNDSALLEELRKLEEANALVEESIKDVSEEEEDSLEEEKSPRTHTPSKQTPTSARGKKKNHGKENSTRSNTVPKSALALAIAKKPTRSRKKSSIRRLSSDVLSTASKDNFDSPRETPRAVVRQKLKSSFDSSIKRPENLSEEALKERDAKLSDISYKIEDAVFQHFNGVDSRYKTKMREIFGCARNTDISFSNRIWEGKVDIDTLPAMNMDDFETDMSQKKEKIRQQAIRNTVVREPQFYIKKTHKGEEIIGLGADENEHEAPEDPLEKAIRKPSLTTISCSDGEKGENIHDSSHTEKVVTTTQEKNEEDSFTKEVDSGTHKVNSNKIEERLSTASISSPVYPESPNDDMSIMLSPVIGNEDDDEDDNYKVEEDSMETWKGKLDDERSSGIPIKITPLRECEDVETLFAILPDTLKIRGRLDYSKCFKYLCDVEETDKKICAARVDFDGSDSFENFQKMIPHWLAKKKCGVVTNCDPIIAGFYMIPMDTNLSYSPQCLKKLKQNSTRTNFLAAVAVHKIGVEDKHHHRSSKIFTQNFNQDTRSSSRSNSISKKPSHSSRRGSGSDKKPSPSIDRRSSLSKKLSPSLDQTKNIFDRKDSSAHSSHNSHRSDSISHAYGSESKGEYNSIRRESSSSSRSDFKSGRRDSTSDRRNSAHSHDSNSMSYHSDTKQLSRKRSYCLSDKKDAFGRNIRIKEDESSFSPPLRSSHRDFHERPAGYDPHDIEQNNHSSQIESYSRTMASVSYSPPHEVTSPLSLSPAQSASSPPNLPQFKSSGDLDTLTRLREFKETIKNPDFKEILKNVTAKVSDNNSSEEKNPPYQEIPTSQSPLPKFTLSDQTGNAAPGNGYGSSYFPPAPANASASSHFLPNSATHPKNDQPMTNNMPSSSSPYSNLNNSNNPYSNYHQYNNYHSKKFVNPMLCNNNNNFQGSNNHYNSNHYNNTSFNNNYNNYNNNNNNNNNYNNNYNSNYNNNQNNNLNNYNNNQNNNQNNNYNNCYNNSGYGSNSFRNSNYGNRNNNNRNSFYNRQVT